MEENHSKNSKHNWNAQQFQDKALFFRRKETYEILVSEDW